MRDDGTGLLENVGGALRIAWALATPFLRGRRVRWGATEAEWSRRYPGDDLVPHPRWQFLHAIDIDAPAPDVWPWIAQVGQGRGGFYSYEGLENLAGCRIRNADRVHPELQDVSAGAPIRLHPKAPPLTAALVEPGHALVLHGASDLRTGEAFDVAGPAPARYVNLSWAIGVEPSGAGRSRLFSRERADYGGGIAIEIGYGPALVEPVSFVMDTKMLVGIRRRVEAERRRAKAPR
jgi:hypothetical protein